MTEEHAGDRHGQQRGRDLPPLESGLDATDPSPAGAGAMQAHPSGDKDEQRQRRAAGQEKAGMAARQLVEDAVGSERMCE